MSCSRVLLGAVVLTQSILPSVGHSTPAAFSPPLQPHGPPQRKLLAASPAPAHALFEFGRLQRSGVSLRRGGVLGASPIGSEQDPDRDFPVQPRYSDPGVGMMRCFIRYTVDGGKMGRDGRILTFLQQAGNGRVSGARILELLQAEGIDLGSFKACTLDQLAGGWVGIEPDMTFDYDESSSKRVDVKLVPAWDPAFARQASSEQRGYFQIGVLGLRHAQNLGTLWRSAFQMGAASVFMIGGKYDRMATDVTRAWTNVPMFEFDNWTDFAKATPYSAQLVAVEMGGEPLETFEHPERAVYVLGSESTGIPQAIVRMCHSHVTLPSVRYESFNVAVAGSILMYDRLVKSGGLKDDVKGLLAHENAP